MAEPIGEAFIRIRPDLTGFREEVRRTVGGALPAVQQQVAAAAPAATRGGLILPPGVRSVTEQATVSTKALGTASKATSDQLKQLDNTQRLAATGTSKLSRELRTAERDSNRFARGTIAATAASSGLFRAVSFASGAFLVGALAGGAIASAVQQFRDMTVVGAQTAAIIKATGGAAHVSATQVEEFAKAQSLTTGVQRDLIQQGDNVLLTFRNIRNEVGAGNDIFNRASRDLLDIASIFHTNLSSSAIQLGKALQDPVKGVTALRRSGITLTAAEREQIKVFVESGRILSAQKLILGEVESQVGGTARAVGETLPGQLNILKERARQSLGEYVKRMSESKRATQIFEETVAGAGNVLTTLKGVVKTLGPPLIQFAEALGKTVQFLGGAQAILVAAVAFKGLKVAIGIATAAQALYTRSVLVGTGAIAAQDAALLASTGAFRRQAVSALAGQTLAVRGAAGAAGREIEVGAVGAIGARATAAAAGTGVLRVALNALGGPLGVAAIGAGALAIGFLKLRHSADQAPGSINATRKALEQLNQAVATSQKLAAASGQRRQGIDLARVQEQGARGVLAAAQNALSGSTAQPGSLENRALIAKVSDAQIQLTRAIDNRRRAEAALIQVEDEARNREAGRIRVITETRNKILDQVEALRRAAVVTVDVAGHVGTFNKFAQAKIDTASLASFVSLMQKLADSGGQVNRTVGRTLAILGQIRGIPTSKQISLVVRATLQGKNTNQILAALGILDPTQGGAAVEANRIRGVTPTSATLFQQVRAAREAVKNAQSELAARQKLLTTRRQELQAAKDQVAAAKDALLNAQQAQRDAQQALADARQAALDAQQNLRDTIAAARQQVNQAVADAKTNLDSLGQAIASTLAQAGVAVQGTGGALGKQFRNLRDQILRGQGGPETQRAAAQVAARLQAQGSTAASDFQRRLADLTDSLNRGKVTLPQFNKQLNQILKGVDFSDLRKRFGSAFVNQLIDELNALRKQAALILGGPSRPGGGAQQTLVRPLQAVAAAARAIAQARRDVVSAQRGIASAQNNLAKTEREVQATERRLRAAQSRESRANTAAIKANTASSKALARVIAAQNRLTKNRKPSGQGSQTAGTLTQSGAVTP